MKSQEELIWKLKVQADEKTYLNERINRLNQVRSEFLDQMN